MSRSDLNISRWLEAHSDRNAGLVTLPGNAALSDVAGDGDFRLVLNDLKLDKDQKSRLKIYKGTLLTSDVILQDIPSALISFYTDNIDPKIPAIAVSCGSDLYIFKNAKPYFKFSIPAVPLNPLETEVWTRLGNGGDVRTAVEELKTVNFNDLSARSQHFLTLSGSKAEEFVGKFGGSLPVKNVPITCMSTLKKSSLDAQGVACPVLATESGDVFILDPQSFTIAHQANTCNIKSSPMLMRTVGLFEVEFRIVIACRENHVSVLRRGWLEGKCLIQTTEAIVDLLILPGDNFIIIATNDKTLHCYTKRGQRLWSTQLFAPISCLGLVTLQHISAQLIAVGMKGGAIHLYKGRQPVDYTSAPDTPSIILFGQMGQEEHVLVVITIGGTLNFKILKRTADFNLGSQEAQAIPAPQSKPLPLPKRSKLFLEQSLRERQEAAEMHKNFQQDLVRIRLTAARALVQTLSDQTGVGNEKELVKLSAQVLGLGPKFTLILTLENMDSEKAVTGLTVVFHTKPSLYKLSSYVHPVPLIPPSLGFKMETKVTEMEKDLEEVVVVEKQVIRVFVVREGQAQPVLAATINMPPTEIPSV